MQHDFLAMIIPHRVLWRVSLTYCSVEKMRRPLGIPKAVHDLRYAFKP